MPLMTALDPAVLVTTIVAEPPAPTSMVKWSHAPWLKDVVRDRATGPEPSSTETVWRRVDVS
jgi:hypothetical protein